jgi:hypothetical protein
LWIIINDDTLLEISSETRDVLSSDMRQTEKRTLTLGKYTL